MVSSGSMQEWTEVGCRRQCISTSTPQENELEPKAESNPGLFSFDPVLPILSVQWRNNTAVHRVSVLKT
jgi:hypothetical protein